MCGVVFCLFVSQIKPTHQLSALLVKYRAAHVTACCLTVLFFSLPFTKLMAIDCFIYLFTFNQFMQLLVQQYLVYQSNWSNDVLVRRCSLQIQYKLRIQLRTRKVWSIDMVWAGFYYSFKLEVICGLRQFQQTLSFTLFYF